MYIYIFHKYSDVVRLPHSPNAQTDAGAGGDGGGEGGGGGSDAAKLVSALLEAGADVSHPHTLHPTS